MIIRQVFMHFYVKYGRILRFNKSVYNIIATCFNFFLILIALNSFPGGYIRETVPRKKNIIECIHLEMR